MLKNQKDALQSQKMAFKNQTYAMAGRIKQDEQLVIKFNSRNCMVVKVGEGGWVFFLRQ